MEIIPYEVVQDIIKFVPNIDVRREFHIYDKIRTENFEILNTVIRKKCQESNIMYERYYFTKNKEFESLQNEPHLNDFVDIIYRENEDKIKVEIQIWKLREKTDEFTHHINDGIYYVSIYDDAYYWKDVTIKYEIN